MNVNSKFGLLLNVSFQVSHLEVIINPVNNKIWKPGVLAFRFEETAEQLEAVLAEVVSENLE